jgi:WD40 repeat protein
VTSEREIIRCFTDAVRLQIEHAARDAGRDLREISPVALLALLCGGAFSAVAGTGADIRNPVFVTGPMALPPAGGILEALMASAIDGVRALDRDQTLPPNDLAREITWRLQQVLASEDDQAAGLRAEIAAVFEGSDVMRSALVTAIETENQQLLNDVIAAIDVLSSAFGEMNFLLCEGDYGTAEMQRRLDGQGAEFRALSELARRQSADVRIVRENLAAIRTRRSLAGLGAVGTAAGGTSWGGGCPYRGLLPFDEAHAGVFYGRQRMTADLIVKLTERLTGPAMVVVSGASGAGKSSLLHAGLLPALAAGRQLEGSDRWPCVVMTPAGDPLSELATRLASLGGGDVAAIRRDLAHPGRAHLAVGQAVRAGHSRPGARPPAGGWPRRLVLVVDQFEEVFTLNSGRGDAGQQAFIAALCAAATRPSGPDGEPPALVIVAVRGDFWDRCAAHAGLARMMQDGLFVVGPMTDAELRETITGPAAAAGLQIDANLADIILSDLRAAGREETEGILPLVSQAMMLTWDKRDGDRLTVRGYNETGGVARSVEFGAEAVYAALPDAEQLITREIFQALVLISPDGQLTRRPARRADLCPDRRRAARRAIDNVLEAFAGSRLLLLDRDTVQIAHDVLLRAWPRLRGWLDREQASWILYTQLQEDAAQWAEHGRDSSFLYRGSQLVAVQQAAARWATEAARYRALTRDQSEFLQASGRSAARGTRIRRTAVIALAALLIVSAVSAGAAGLAAHVARTAAGNASRQASRALSGELAAESEQLDASDPVTAAQLAAASWRIAPTAQARQSMLDVLAQPERAAVAATRGKLPITAMASARGGHVLITAGSDGMIRLWDVATRRELGAPLTPSNIRYEGGGNRGVTMALSPLGNLLATAGEDGGVRLWNLTGRHQIGPRIGPAGFDGIDSHLAFSPDGKILAVIDGTGKLRLWDVASRKPVGITVPSAAGQGVNSMAFSPDGKFLATGVGGTLELWSMATGREVAGPVRAVDAADALVMDLAFSPNGNTLATVGGDGKLHLWRIPYLHETGTLITARNQDPNSNGATAVRFSPDGTTVATGGNDGMVRLWDLTARQQVGPALAASTGAPLENNDINAILFSPDGTTLATAGMDGIIRLWDVSVYQPIGSPIAAVGVTITYAAAFSPDGKILAINGNGKVRLWNVASHRQVGQALADPSLDETLAFSPDGRILATGDADGRVRLWNVATRRQIGSPIGNAGNDGFRSLAYSPTGAILATGGADGKAKLWSVTTGKPIGRPLIVANGGKVTVDAVALSPDGQILATGSGDGKARLWNLTTHRKLVPPITGINSATSATGVEALAFNPAGSVLATAGTDGTARLWNVATGRENGPAISAGRAGRDLVTAIAFTRGGSILVTSNYNGAVRLWDTATLQQIGPDITPPSDPARTLGLAVSPDAKMLATVGNSTGTAQLWNIAFPANLPNAVCKIAGTSFTRGQWNSYIQSRRYQEVC